MQYTKTKQLMDDTTNLQSPATIFPAAVPSIKANRSRGNDVNSKHYRHFTTDVADGTIAAIGIAKEME